MWLVKLGDDPTGRVLWEQPGEASLNNWSILWKSLRSRVGDETYREGERVLGFRDDADGVTVLLDNHQKERFDLLVGADGYRSLTRSKLFPETHIDYAGYVLWRGNFPEERVTDRGPIDEADQDNAWHTICFPEGHGVFYMIPGSEDRAEVGHRRVNWAVYAATPDGLVLDTPASIAPGDITPQVEASFRQILADHFPPWHRGLLELTRPKELSIQPIYDETVPAYRSGMVMLIGDAGTVTRPHTGSGATKALQEALLLEELCVKLGDWESILSRYDAERTAAGNSIVELGRRLGAAQVENTPPWREMKPSDFEDWVSATLSGSKLYFYGDKE